MDVFHMIYDWQLTFSINNLIHVERTDCPTWCDIEVGQ